MQPNGFRLDKAKQTRSVCPYCSVGCAIIIYTINGRIVNIEGDPQSPHSEGCLCPKGAAALQLHYNRHRADRVLHRKPGAKKWDEVSLNWAMGRVAELVQKTRDATFVERLQDGTEVNHTTALFALGGATLDNEWNHLQQKLMRGLGVVAIENQARI
jgi:formate dehydrogenase major subunit